MSSGFLTCCSSAEWLGKDTHSSTAAGKHWTNEQAFD